MYNYDNEYTPPGYETNYEFNPQYESAYETANYEGEFDNEYEMNPQFEMEQNYEAGNDYEDEASNWQNEVIVRDHRRGAGQAGMYRPSTSRPVVVSTRPAYNRPPYNRLVNPASIRPAYQRAPYNRYRWPFNYNRYRNYPWNRRYIVPVNYGVGNIGQWSQPQYPQNNDMNTQPPGLGGSAPQGGSAPDYTNQGGGVPNYILESIKNLTQQVAATNANVQALQQSMAAGRQDSSMGMPPPGGNQPNTGMPSGAGMNTPPPSNTTMTSGSDTGIAPPASGSELEMEDYEYGMGNEMMENEDSNNEMMEMELAAELLATNNEMELDHFLDGLVGGGLKKLFSTVVKKVLPVAGAAAGTFFGGPLGTMVGGKIGNAAAGVFELELEGLSNEDQEFEVARAVIRLANDAVRELAEGNSTGNPNQDAKNALIQSALRNAPGLLVKKQAGQYNNNSNYGGNWYGR